MKRYLLAALTACAVGFSGCSNDPTVNPNGNNVSGSDVTFFQVDRVGKPGIKALYLPFATHAAYNTAIPENDVAAYGPTVSTFVTGTAGRSAAIGGFAATLLVPDALIVNLNDASTRASYLGWETNGQIPADCTGLTGTTFGGRALQDDVVDVDLGLAFGNLATSATIASTSPPLNVAATPPPDDGNESNGTGGKPNLTKQNVSCAGKGFTLGTFPYLAPPV